MISKRKTLLFSALLATPVLASWSLRHGETKPNPPIASQHSKDSIIRIPVEVVKKGAQPEWIQVEIRPQPSH